MREASMFGLYEDVNQIHEKYRLRDLGRQGGQRGAVAVHSPGRWTSSLSNPDYSQQGASGSRKSRVGQRKAYSLAPFVHRCLLNEQDGHRGDKPPRLAVARDGSLRRASDAMAGSAATANDSSPPRQARRPSPRPGEDAYPPCNAAGRIGDMGLRQRA
jgi:hypothetical protein